MDPISRSGQPTSAKWGGEPSASASGQATTTAPAKLGSGLPPLLTPHETFHPSPGVQDPLLSLPLPSRGVAWAFATQLSGTTWAWIKKIYPECDGDDREAESCLFSALGDLLPPAFEHSNRVGQLASRFARQLGLTQSERRELGRAARFKECGFIGLQLHMWSEQEREEAAEVISLGGAFHDIGKIAVSRDILNKPGPLTQEERNLINLHPLIGEALLQKIASVESLLPAVRHHHERWDGAGYVDGLAGDKIPWQARIIAIVDSFDAMTEERPYRAGALSEQEACWEIISHKGTQFDPELADKFARMFDV